MPSSVIFKRVVNEQTINRSILIDKIDRSQGNFEGYAQKAKQKVYVPFVNPLDRTVKGYLNLVPTDEVLLSANGGTIKGLQDSGYVSVLDVDSADVAVPVVTGAVHVAGPPAKTTITGTTFTSLYPDVTRVQLMNLASTIETLSSGSFSVFTNISIEILDASVTIGVPGAGWKVRVQSNSNFSNWFTL